MAGKQLAPLPPGPSPRTGKQSVPSPAPSPGAEGASAVPVADKEAPPAAAPPISMGALIKASIVSGHAVEAKRVALDWVTLCSADTQKAIYAVVDAAFELAGISSCLAAEDVPGDPGPFLEQLPERVRERSLDLMSYSFSTTSGRPGKRSVQYWERFFAIGFGTQSVGDILDFKLCELLDRWYLPMSQHGIRTVRHVATVAALSMSQALGHHLREMARLVEINRKQLEAAFDNEGQASRLEREIELLEGRIQAVGVHRSRLLENTIPHRNRDICEVIRLYSLSEVNRLMRAEPMLYLQQKWTARVFLMIHDLSAEVRLKALTAIASWFEKHNSHKAEVKEHILQFAERCMSHLVDRTRDADNRVACKAIQMLRQPVLAERMTDEEVERIVNLVSMGTEHEVRQEAALFVNAQVFQDPGIVMPERQARKRKRGATNRGRADDGQSSDNPDGDENEEEQREAPDNIATLLNSETSISMFIEFLENYMGQNLRVTDRAVNAFWGKAPCLSHWHTMVSLVILGEDHRGPGVDPVSTRQRLILLHVMEACVRRAAEDARRIAASGGREEKMATARMDAACSTIVPELPRLFELCHSEEKQVLIVSHICKMLMEYAESKSMSQVIQSARPLVQVLRQCILNHGFMDVVKHCTDALLVISVFISEVRTQFIDLAKIVHDETMRSAKAVEEDGHSAEELRTSLGKFNVINQRGIDMSFGNVDCLNAFFRLLDLRLEGMRKWQDHCKEKGVEDPGFQFPADMPDTGHVILLVENCMVIIDWYFRFCHWEHHSLGSQAVKDLASMQAAKIRETRSLLPKVFSTIRNQLCALVSADGSPHVKHLAFSTYMTIMQVAVGVSEGIDVEGSDAALPPGQVVKSVEDLDKIKNPGIPVEHMKILWEYLNGLLTQVQGSHAVHFSDEGQRVEPHDIWPPFSSDGQVTSFKVMLQELIEDNHEITSTNNFEAEDGDKGDQRRMLRAVFAARMVLESEVEDVLSGPLGQVVLTQLDRSKPKPLREIGLKLKRRLRDNARICADYADQYFEAQMIAVIGLYDQVGIEAARSLASELSRQWGPRMMPWLEKPLADTLLSAVDECALRGEKGLPLLEAFSFWVKGDEFVTETRRRELAERIHASFGAQGVDCSGARGVQRFVQRCEAPTEPATTPGPLTAPPEAEGPAEAEPNAAPTPLGKRIRGKQPGFSPRVAVPADENEPPAENEEVPSHKKPRIVD